MPTIPARLAKAEVRVGGTVHAFTVGFFDETVADRNGTFAVVDAVAQGVLGVSSHIFCLSGLRGFPSSFVFVFQGRLVEEGLESLQQVIDIPGLPLLIIHHCQEHFDVGSPDLFHILDAIFLLQIVL